jgi:RHS repeat-associated protein
MEYTAGGIIKVSYVHGNDLISQSRPTAQSFYLPDGLGSVRAITSAVGLVTDRYIYDAFGRVLSSVGSTPNTFLFTGEQFDLNLGLYYLRARFLDPSIGRFVSQDPFAGLLQDPISLHNYAYARNDAINWVDPSGRWSINHTMAALAVAGAIAGGAIGAYAGYQVGGVKDAIYLGVAGAILGAFVGLCAGFLIHGVPMVLQARSAARAAKTAQEVQQTLSRFDPQTARSVAEKVVQAAKDRAIQAELTWLQTLSYQGKALGKGFLDMFGRFFLPGFLPIQSVVEEILEMRADQSYSDEVFEFLGGAFYHLSSRYEDASGSRSDGSLYSLFGRLGASTEVAGIRPLDLESTGLI